MFVKICGVTNLEVARAAVDGGAQAIGFIFHQPSPRYIAPEALAAWIDRIPANIWRVGVFVDRPAVEVEDVCGSMGLDVAQLHGTESAADAPAGVRVWKAHRVVRNQIPEAALDYPAEAILLDGPSSGKPFDWSLARGLKQRVILAGGLDESNIAEAIEQAQPWGVDASSSLESSPGIKDLSRLARFLKACQSSAALNHA
jgi:phosphoribosylanthranilate isomerase